MTRLMNDDIPGLAGERDARPGPAAQTCCTNSGLRKENPANSFWSRFIMKSLSVGDSSVFSEVNWRSKLETSFRWRCKREEARGTVATSLARSIVFRATRSLHLARRLYRSSGRSLLHVSLVSVSRDLSLPALSSPTPIGKKNYVSCTNREFVMP